MKNYKWQNEAVNKWISNGKIGIVECPTGSGKTLFGIICMESLRRVTLIVVPTIVIMKQWKSEILKHISNLDENKIGYYYGGEKSISPITIAVINSIRNLDLSYFKMIIIDEIHHAASDKNIKPILNNNFKYRLGLTATLSRDDLKHLKLIEHFAPLIYRYTQEEAIGNGILNTFDIVNIGVNLTEQELKDLTLINSGLYIRDIKLSVCHGDYYKIINELSEKYKDNFLYNMQKDIIIEDINNSIKEGKENISLRLYSLKELFREFNYDYKVVLNIKGDFSYRKLALIKMFNKRKDIFYQCKNKITKTLELVLKHKNDKIIIFNEFNSMADSIYNIIKSHSLIKVGIIHSGIGTKERNENLEKFRKGEIMVIVTSKVLDEGLNVPDCQCGILVASSNTKRQFVQRIGRIIRKKEEPSIIYQLFAIGTRDYVNVEKRKRYLLE